MTKRWTLKPFDATATATLQRQLGINNTLCKLLVQRGYANFDLSKDYFRPTEGQLHHPFLMKDMQKAVDRVLQAFRNQEKILVYGDYDVDGTTSVACMYQFLHKHHPFVDFYLPHRYREGYGVSRAGIDYAAEHGFSLMVALDCGIKSVALVAYAQSLGIDFIICDHHLPDPELPAAVAILNTKQQDCTYPFKELCGCGVGLKLIQALCSTMGLPPAEWQCYLDLVAVAIAADIVPMVGENRVLTYLGLEKVNANPSTGIAALMQLAELKKPVEVTNLVFVIAPRVNAAGRMDDARKAVELFIATDTEAAMEFAKALHADNTDRKDHDKTITEQALKMLDEQPDTAEKTTTVVYNSQWHKGVVGIVASRLIEKHYKPTIVLTAHGNKATGSARSVLGFNVYEAIHQCKDLLDNYGGHFYAAGLTMPIEHVEQFRQRFEAVVAASIAPEMLIPEISIDAEVQFKEINHRFYDIICQMEPFGPGNMRPVFLAKGVKNTERSRIVKENHIKFSLSQGGHTMDGIGFNMADKFAILQQANSIDVVFTLDQNLWNGTISIQLKVMDIRAAS
ncbi:MAG: single-stranded-DNA-specific exonuclease RecJ [Bacteroidetes bacterium]|nr:MAG: single-stranded-DNA-specific exonuclease RecJ [Bacteroidota bacterium]